MKTETNGEMKIAGEGSERMSRGRPLIVGTVVEILLGYRCWKYVE